MWRFRDRERGSITPFVVIVALALLFLGGLVIDGSRQLSSRARAIAYAEEAARAGAQKIDLERGYMRLIQEDAEAAVDEYCAAAASADDSIEECALDGYVEATQGGQIASVTVQVAVTYDPILLDIMPGVSSSYLVEGSATAHPVEGIIEPELEGLELPPPVADTRPVDPGIPTGTDTETEGTVPTPCPTNTDTQGPPNDPPGTGDPPGNDPPGNDECETETSGPPPGTNPPPGDGRN